MITLWRYIKALWSALAGLVNEALSHVRARKNYGRAKRLAWEVLVTVVATAITALLTGLLHGR